MRRILTALSLMCLLSLTAFAQVVHPTEEAPPLPLTLTQLLRAQARTLRSVEQLGYKKRWSYETLTPDGVSTGKREGEWELLWLGGKPRRTTLRDEGDTGSGLSLPDDELSEFSRWLGQFYSPDCRTEFSGYEERDGRLRYRTHYVGAGVCFDGLTWTDGKGTVLEADGRREPYRVRTSEGVEILWTRAHVWMLPSGLPDRMESDDILTLSMSQVGGYTRDKNGRLQPRRVRVRHSFRYYDYRRPRTGEPKVTLGDIVEQ
jgi:hypothetical protein